MTALFVSEIWRLASRRLFKILATIVLAIIALVCLIVFFSTDGDAGLVRYAHDVPLAFRIAAQPLFSLSVVAGGSFVGAEWATGSMATLLTWEPRRGRVLAAKLAAVAACTFAATLIALVVLALLLLPSAIFHGTTNGVDGSWLWSSLGLWLRAGALSAMGAGLGVGLAGILRTSAGAVGTWLLFEFLLSPLLVVWRPGIGRWMPGANVSQFLSVGESVGVSINGQDIFRFSAVRAGLMLAAYAVGLLALSYGALRSRDVT
jgi:hypothetical protein